MDNINAEPAVSFLKSRGFPCQKRMKSVIIKISLIFKNLWKSVIICGQEKVGGREMLKASGGKVKFLGNGEKS